MKFADVPDFIKSHLRVGQHWNKKHITMQDAKWQTLTENTWIAGCEYAAGSQFKVFETTNFGWIVFGPNTLTPNGSVPNRRIINW